MGDSVAADAPVCSVLLLDLHARADGFIGDQQLTALAGRIAAAGYAVRVVRKVASDAPSAERFLAETTEVVRAARADVIALARAGDRAPA